MSVSKTTQLTDKLMRDILKIPDPAEGMRALGYLHAMVANAIIDADGVKWSERKALLEAAAEFCTARASQCWTDEVAAEVDLMAGIRGQVATSYDIPDDPDEDIL